MAGLGFTWPGLPWGLSALREERQQQGFCRLWAGAGSSALHHGYGVFHGEARGPLRSGRVPGFSSTGRYCTEQEEVLIGARGDQASSSCLPTFTLQDGLVPGLVPQEEGLTQGDPKWLLQFYGGSLLPGVSPLPFCLVAA